MRHWRGRTEIAAIEALEPEHGLFGTFRVRSSSDNAYEVEIRDLAGFTNSCGCTDHQVNRLGTCKHIEGVLAALKRCQSSCPPLQGGEDRPGVPRLEIFLAAPGTPAPATMWPKD